MSPEANAKILSQSNPMPHFSKFFIIHLPCAVMYAVQLT
jgi:hypothetical protein